MLNDELIPFDFIRLVTTYGDLQYRIGVAYGRAEDAYEYIYMENHENEAKELARQIDLAYKSLHALAEKLTSASYRSGVSL